MDNAITEDTTDNTNINGHRLYPGTPFSGFSWGLSINFPMYTSLFNLPVM